MIFYLHKITIKRFYSPKAIKFLRHRSKMKKIEFNELIALRNRKIMSGYICVCIFMYNTKKCHFAGEVRMRLIYEPASIMQWNFN
jgi:hypothetical protein